MILATHEPNPTQTPLQTTSPEVAELEAQAKAERNHQQFGHYFAKALFYWNRILTVLLTFHTIEGAWKAFHFVLVTSPELNEKLASGQVSIQEVNNLTAMAITLAVMTVVYAVLAIRLHKVSRESEPTLELLLSMVVLALSSVIENRISMIDFVSLVGIFF